MPRPYTSRAGEALVAPTLEDVAEFADDPDFDCTGWCLACGEIHEGVDPDARADECDVCGARKVYGLAELALMGLLR